MCVLRGKPIKIPTEIAAYCGQSSHILYEGIQLISHLQNNVISNNWRMQTIKKIFVTYLMNIPVEYTHGMFVINIQLKYTTQIFVWNIRNLNVCFHRVLTGKYLAKMYVPLTLIITNILSSTTSPPPILWRTSIGPGIVIIMVSFVLANLQHLQLLLLCFHLQYFRNCKMISLSSLQ